MKTIPLTQGQVALVDDEDYEALSKFKWYANIQRKGRGEQRYAVRNAHKPEGRGQVYMHRQILPGVTQIDHRYGNGLNNQRENLRPSTPSQNIANQKKTYRNRTSKYKGVHLHTQLKKWSVQVNHKHVGLFVDEEDAARAYDRAALKVYGEFARLNFPELRADTSNNSNAREQMRIGHADPETTPPIEAPTPNAQRS